MNTGPDYQGLVYKIHHHDSHKGVDMWLLRCSQWFLVCFCIAEPETLIYDSPHLHVSVYSVFRNYQDRYYYSWTAGELVNIPSAHPVGPWNVIFCVSSAFQSKIPHYVSLPCDGRLSAVPFVWSQTYSSLFILRSQRHVPNIYQLWHVSVWFCITLTVSVKRERPDKQRDRDPLFSKRVNCCFLCLLCIFQWLMPIFHSGVLPLVSSVFCKIVIFIEIRNSTSSLDA